MQELYPSAIFVTSILFLLAWIFHLLDKSSMRRKSLEPENPITFFKTLPIFERLDVLQRLNFQLKTSAIGKTYAVGEFQGHRLGIESGSNSADPLIQITMLAKPSLVSSERQTPQYSISDIEARLSPNDPMLHGIIDINRKEKTVSYSQKDSELNVSLLKDAMRYLIELIDVYPDIINHGGQIVPKLLDIAEKHPTRELFIVQALQDISADTTTRLADNLHQLVCPTCLTRFSSFNPSGYIVGTQTYYGCRTCKQGRDFLIGELVAVLDEGQTTPILTRNASVRVNWLTHKQPFDFDRVEIVQASDEAIERFAVQVGNDTDAHRRERYQQMECRVSPACAPSENTMRILDNTFGQIIRK